MKKKTTAPQQCKTSAPGLELYLSYLRLVAPPPLADFVSEQRGGVTLPPSVFKVHPKVTVKFPGCEVPRFLFLGLCLNFHYFSTGVVFPKLGFDFSRRAVAQALVEP